MISRFWFLSSTYRVFQSKSAQSLFIKLREFSELSQTAQSCFEATMKRNWNKPEGENELKVYNSLTKEKNDFIPHNGRLVKWYSCGPTVYDASHMGHARSYIAFDILRRVLQNYFNYDVFYVMNITDVDDKIIFRARRNFLMKKYKSESHSLDKVLSDVDEACKKFSAKLQTTTDLDKKNMMEKIMEDVDKEKKYLENLKTSGNENSEAINAGRQALLEKAHDPLSALLDSKFGSEITDHKIFAELTQYWEQEFHNDMEALNILPVDCLTRVSQYVPEIITYIENIIKNGFAYEAEGSVYFNTVKFASSERHEYARLVPEAVGDLDALAEGEGELSQNNESEKKSNRDFALWKASKPGEPEWPSPWGKGRPGWHIECSVMASDVLDYPIDIHTGGVDLKFPHHDNELAQAEAHYSSNQWVNYFLHAGHLTIEGCKMSKSLKNFITIKDALATNSARQIRLAFLLHAWNSTLDYSENVLKEAVQVEKLFNDFFLSVKDILRKPKVSSLPSAHNYQNAEKELRESFHKKKSQVHLALCDSIDTPTALLHMQALVKQANIYVASKKQANESPNHMLLENIAKYITDILRIFGANQGQQSIGFQTSSSSASDNHEDIALPYVQLLSDFREQVRNIARQEKVGKILKLCDELRDEGLPNLGVKLEDQEENQSSVIKFVDRDTLLKEKQQQLEEMEKRKREKEEAKKKMEEEKAAKMAKAQLPPSEMFKNENDKYSAFDEQLPYVFHIRNEAWLIEEQIHDDEDQIRDVLLRMHYNQEIPQVGIPTHDKDGQPISAKHLKKLKKLHQQQEKLYNTAGPGADKNI